MPRTTRPAPFETTHELRAWRKARGLTLEQLAETLGMTNQNLGKIERGLVPLGGEYLAPLARALDVQPSDLFRRPEEGEAEPWVRIIGRVGADAEGAVVYVTGQESGDMAPLPPGGTKDSVALEVVGHSMRAIAEDGSLIYFELQRTPPSPEMVGYPCIVETEDGRVLLKRLLKGSRPGLYDLESQIGPTLEDVRIRWAAEPTAIIPPRQARRIIKRSAA